MKSISGLLGGYLTIVFLEGFIRLVISVYHRIPISFSGLESFPSQGWFIFFLLLMFIIGAFGNMLTCTITGFEYARHSISLGVLFLITRGLSELIMTSGEEYLQVSLIMASVLIGIASGYFLINKLHKSPEQTDV
jgi:hypothetical protein